MSAKGVKMTKDGAVKYASTKEIQKMLEEAGWKAEKAAKESK